MRQRLSTVAVPHRGHLNGPQAPSTTTLAWEGSLAILPSSSKDSACRPHNRLVRHAPMVIDEHASAGGQSGLMLLDQTLRRADLARCGREDLVDDGDLGWMDRPTTAEAKALERLRGPA